eukprot:849486_1
MKSKQAIKRKPPHLFRRRLFIKGGFCDDTSKPTNSNKVGSQRKLFTDAARRSSRHIRQLQMKEDISTIKKNLCDYQHHGTGNPLIVRCPTTSKDYAVLKLVEIIKQGSVGKLANSSTSFQLKTERGKSGTSFWTTQIPLAGSYGWTGVIIPSCADSSQPLPTEKVSW